MAPVPASWRRGIALFGLVAGCVLHFYCGPLPLLSALITNSLPQGGKGPGGGLAFFTNWVLTLHSLYFIAAFTLDVAIMWSAFATGRRACKSESRVVGSKLDGVTHWTLPAALAHADRFYFVAAIFAMGMGGLFHIQWIIDGFPPVFSNGMLELHMAPLWRALAEAVVVPHRLRHGPWWVAWPMALMLSSAWSLHYFTYFALCGEHVYEPPWPASQFALIIFALPAVHLILAGIALGRVLLCRRFCLGRWRRVRNTAEIQESEDFASAAINDAAVGISAGYLSRMPSLLHYDGEGYTHQPSVPCQSCCTRSRASLWVPPSDTITLLTAPGDLPEDTSDSGQYFSLRNRFSKRQCLDVVLPIVACAFIPLLSIAVWDLVYVV